jgi:hypothetical protein
VVGMRRPGWQAAIAWQAAEAPTRCVVAGATTSCAGMRAGTRFDAERGSTRFSGVLARTTLPAAVSG